MPDLSPAARRHTHLFPCLALILGIASAPTGPALAQGHDYKLGPQDKIRVRVTEWRTASGPVEWTAVNGEYVVGASGLLSIPLVGTVNAQSAALDELSSIISERLKNVAGLVVAPSAAVEIVDYRPFYVTGAVQNPGGYPYRPGLTALQAVTLAGGLYRPDSSARSTREQLSSEGEIEVNEALRWSLILRQDRLRSESEDRSNIAFSAEVLDRAKNPAIAQGMAQENMIFTSRLTSLQSQTRLLEQTKAMLDEQLKTLAAKEGNHTQQNELIRKELGTIKGLAAKGLATSPRELALEQNLAQLQGQQLDLDLAVARTRQDINQAERDLAELRNQRANEVHNELRETHVSLRQIEEKIRSQRALILESQIHGLDHATLQQEGLSIALKLVRKDNSESREWIVADTDAIEPGDLVKVEIQTRGSTASLAQGNTADLAP
ncbi:polysaccharide biosynthesis/export family protein [Terrihabitans sp. B22-R8]|uniref:polysaccharide biosynthesis/export family protein n=1 Tax=Terrihabitans sp. B22-R8 TaxID=3425128 RepID=UPI00403C68B5